MNKDTQGPSVALFEADPEASSALATSLALGSITDMAAFVGVFLAGGHGTMWDFPKNDELGSILGNAISHGKAVGAVCHGVAGLATDEIATALRGKSACGFSNEEEAAAGLTEVVPFLLETKLTDAGVTYNGGAMFTPYVVTDGSLITGQNPMSSQATAEAMIQVLIKA